MIKHVENQIKVAKALLESLKSDNIGECFRDATVKELKKTVGYRDTRNIKMICNDCDSVYIGHLSSICPDCHGHNTQNLDDRDLENDYEAVRGDV